MRGHDRYRTIWTLLLSVFFFLLSFGCTFLSFRDARELQIILLSISIGLSASLVIMWLSKDKTYGTQLVIFSNFAFIAFSLLLLANSYPLLRTWSLPLVPDVRLNVIHVETQPIFEHYGFVLGHEFVAIEVEVEPVWGAKAADVHPHAREFELVFEGEPQVYEVYRDLPGTCNWSVEPGETLLCNLIFQIPEPFERGTLRFNNPFHFDEVEVNF